MAERYGWGAEWIIAPALIALADTLVWTGDFDEAEGLQRAARAVHTEPEKDIRLLPLHQTAGILHAGRGRHHEALQGVRRGRTPGIAAGRDRTRWRAR